MRSCEESWKLIARLREKVSPQALRAIVKRCGLPTSGERSGMLDDSMVHPASLTSTAQWLTMADLRVQAVKEICYEIALDDFRYVNEEIFSLCKNKMKTLCSRYGKRDLHESDSWFSVAKDVMDTIGSGDGASLVHIMDPPLPPSEFISPEDDITLQPIIGEDINDLIDEMLDKVCMVNDSNSVGNIVSTLKVKDEAVARNVEKEFSKINDLVEQLSNSKRSASELSGKIINLILDHVKEDDTLNNSVLTEPCDENDKIERTSIVLSDNASDCTDYSEISKDSRSSPKMYKAVSHRYVRSNDFSCPSPGVVLPYEFSSKEEQIAWLMDNDKAFRRGRQRWIAQQKAYEKNLEMRKINKEKRRMQREQGETEKQESQKFRFKFKGSGQNQKSDRQSYNRYNAHPRRKTIGCSEDIALNCKQGLITTTNSEVSDASSSQSDLPREQLTKLGNECEPPFAPKKRRDRRRYVSNHHKTVSLQNWRQDICHQQHDPQPFYPPKNVYPNNQKRYSGSYVYPEMANSMNYPQYHGFYQSNKPFDEREQNGFYYNHQPEQYKGIYGHPYFDNYSANGQFQRQ